MGANSEQGWALFLFLIGFTFLPAGLYSLGSIFAIAGLVCLAVSAVWFVKIKPLEHIEPGRKG
jgi:membrane-bound ClpP family serine protease